MPGVLARDSRRVAVGDGIEICYESFGDRDDPAILLIAGFWAQLLAWPPGFVDELVKRGHFVVRFDNRDAGLSTHLHDAPRPDPRAAFEGDVSSASYTLSDMAGDVAGLMDALGLQSAHIVGVSMGGMIGQTLAIERPDRVHSLTSVMSTTGNPAVGQSTEAALAALLAPPARTRQDAVERVIATLRVIGSPAYKLDEAGIRARSALAFDRANDPIGVGRQLLAILASGDRTPQLRHVHIPTLVLHGADDPLISLSGGRATAEAIPGAELVVIEGMGHDLPPQLWAMIAAQIAGLVTHARRLR
jgi:pimeloyl-ACP methyl ester carboxylesterase